MCKFFRWVFRMTKETKLDSVGFTMPSDFPTNVYNNVHSHLSQHKDTHPTQWFTFSLGWNGLAYRYRAMAEYDKEFTISVKESASPLPEERYKQGKSLFGFTMNVISVTESLLFSAYCIGSILDPTVFPLAKTGHLRFSPNIVKEKFARAFPNDPLTIQIEKLLNEATYKEMSDMRIVLFHRGTVPRKFYVGGERSGIATMPINPSELSDQWQYDLQVNENMTSSRRQWLSAIVQNLVITVNDFCNRKL